MTAAADAPTITVSTPLRRFPPNAEDGTRPAHHLNDSKTKFGNPWPSFRPHTFSQIFSIPYTVATKMPSIPADVKSRIPTRSPTWGVESDPDRQRGKATWLGHACYLLELPAPPNAPRGIRIIFDPVFSTRCSPFSFLGPVRYTDPPCKIEDVPEVDAIVISHNHYDHMDIPTLRALLTKRPSSNPHIFVGLNNARCFQRQLDLPNERVHEMDWYDERVLNVNLSPEGENAKVRITSTPSQHMSARGLFDRNASLWSAWAIEELLPPASPSSDPSVGKKLYFAGDTAYRTVPSTSPSSSGPTCPAFAETGERFGGFDLALIPIGAYAPRNLFSNMHASPGDAVGIFRDLRAKKAAGMH